VKRPPRLGPPCKTFWIGDLHKRTFASACMCSVHVSDISRGGNFIHVGNSSSSSGTTAAMDVVSFTTAPLQFCNSCVTVSGILDEVCALPNRQVWSSCTKNQRGCVGDHTGRSKLLGITMPGNDVKFIRATAEFDDADALECLLSAISDDGEIAQ